MTATSGLTGYLAGKHHPAPQGRINDKHYSVFFATDEATIDAALRLRFEVFNLELGEGLETSFASMRDRDRFDAQCHHLVVQEKQTGGIIGTYRMQTSAMAGEGLGFYSAGEFYLEDMPAEVLGNAIEVGRACIAREHRNGRVLLLLWRGLAMYMLAVRKRYLFGCCSLTSQDPVEGWSVMRYLEAHDHLLERFRLRGRPDYLCPPLAGHLELPETPLPRLFRTYLNYGAKVCSDPVIDRQFKTIDYLVVLDLQCLDVRDYQLFFA